MLAEPSTSSGPGPQPPGVEPLADSPPPRSVTPPRMPAPPMMPGAAPSVPTWGAPVPPAAPPPARDTQPPPPLPSATSPGAPIQEPAGDATPSGAEEGAPGPEAPVDAGADVDTGTDHIVASAQREPTTVAPRAGTRAVAPVVQGDWLASVCPYLASEDGTYRSAAPDAGHRCIAVDPPATLPLAFQERFCLTDRHPRCEMYKYAQEVGQDGGIPVEVGQLHAAATRPVRSGISSAGGGARPAVLAAIAVGGIAILVLLLVLLLGSCSGEPVGTDDDPTAEPQASGAPQATRTPRATARPAPERTPEPDPDSTPGPTAEGVGGTVTILYQIQEGEGLRKVADTFGITRKRILRANPGLEDIAPADLPGETISIPVPPGMPIEEVEALPGYAGALP